METDLERVMEWVLETVVDGCRNGCRDRCRDGCEDRCRDRCDIVGAFGNCCQDHWGGGGSGRGVVMKIDQYEISIVHKNC